MTRIEILHITSMRRVRFNDGREWRVNVLLLLWPGDLDLAPEALGDLPEEPSETAARKRRRD